MTVVRESMQGRSKTVFRDEVRGVKAMKSFVAVRERAIGFPVVLWEELARVGDMAFCPFELVKFRQILGEIVVGLETFCHRAKINYSGSGEFVPNLPDNGVG